MKQASPIRYRLLRTTGRLLRTKHAAAYLGRSQWQLRKLAQDGVIPVVIDTDDSPWYFDVDDLDKFIESHKRASPWDRS